MAEKILHCDSDDIRQKVEMYKYEIPDNVLTSPCDYMDIDNIWKMNPSRYNFKVMHLNIRGLVSKQEELKELLVPLQYKGRTRLDSSM